MILCAIHLGTQLVLREYYINRPGAMMKLFVVLAAILLQSSTELLASSSFGMNSSRHQRQDDDVTITNHYAVQPYGDHLIHNFARQQSHLVQP